MVRVRAGVEKAGHVRVGFRLRCVTLQNMIPSLKAIGDLDDSAEEVAAETDYVREVTGSERVNLVGHSQGGTHPKTYQQMYGTPEAVARVVTIAGSSTERRSTVPCRACCLSSLTRLARGILGVYGRDSASGRL